MQRKQIWVLVAALAWAITWAGVAAADLCEEPENLPAAAPATGDDSDDADFDDEGFDDDDFDEDLDEDDDLDDEEVDVFAGIAISESCVTDLDQILLAIDITPTRRVDCGRFGYFEIEEIQDALRCFDAAVAEFSSAEFTVNNCIDCAIPSTYVAEVDQGVFEITVESDVWGDSMGTVKVLRCKDVCWDKTDEVRCASPEVVHLCKAPLPERR